MMTTSSSQNLILTVAIALLVLPRDALAGGRFLKGERARVLQEATSAQDHRIALEALLREEAEAIEDAYNALVHAGEEVDMCYVTSVCAPRSEFSLSRVDMYQPKNCKDSAGSVAPWTSVARETCPVNPAVTRAMYDLDLDNPSAIYPKRQGEPNQANWRDVALQTPPSVDRVKKVMCATNPLDNIWRRQYNEVPNTFWQYYARRSSAEHLIATKAMRCTATAWIPHCR